MTYNHRISASSRKTRRTRHIYTQTIIFLPSFRPKLLCAERRDRPSPASARTTWTRFGAAFPLLFSLNPSYSLQFKNMYLLIFSSPHTPSSVFFSPDGAATRTGVMMVVLKNRKKQKKTLSFKQKWRHTIRTTTINSSSYISHRRIKLINPACIHLYRNLIGLIDLRERKTPTYNHAIYDTIFLENQSSFFISILYVWNNENIKSYALSILQQSKIFRATFRRVDYNLHVPPEQV